MNSLFVSEPTVDLVVLFRRILFFQNYVKMIMETMLQGAQNWCKNKKKQKKTSKNCLFLIYISTSRTILKNRLGVFQFIHRSMQAKSKLICNICFVASHSIFVDTCRKWLFEKAAGFFDRLKNLINMVWRLIFT